MRYRVQFDRSGSNLVGVGRVTKLWRRWVTGAWLTPRNTSPHMCCRVQFARSMYKRNYGDLLEKFDPLRPALQGHSRLSESTWFDRSVGYLCLPINVRGNDCPISYTLRDKRRFQ